MSVSEFLSGVRGFEGIAPDDMANLAAGAKVLNFAAGQALMRAGQPGDTMHVIRSGQVRVPIRDAAGAEKMVFHLGPGELVGEMALLTGEPRSADVIAESAVETVVLDRAVLTPVLEEYPSLAQLLTEILGRRLEQKGGIERVGKYRLLGKLGEGTSGKVYEALHPELNRVVALKMLSHSLVFQAKFRERFLEEARLVASLNHPNIVQVYDTESAYATYFIVMQKLSGSDLASQLRLRKTFGPREAAAILRQMAAALAYSHAKGFAHRDVKPANVALDEAGLVQIMDFGLARPVPVGDPTRRVQTVDGTPQYIAPETAMGKVADGRVDLYALGVIGFEMLTGRLPFESQDVVEMLKAHVRTPPPDIRALKPDLPEGLLRFVEGTLIKDPDQRLSDPDRIQHLLDLEGTGPGLWSDASEQVIHLRFRPSATERVEQAVERLMDELSGGTDVEVTSGRLARPERQRTGPPREEEP
jgi:serine/threonine protein kinase